MILVLGATGMFGSRVANHLTDLGQPVRALVRNEDKARRMLQGEPELVVGDLDHPETLAGALTDVEKVFLVSPMDGHIAEREIAVIEAAERAGVGLVVKLYGAVRHDGDALDVLHQASISALRQSGLRWALVSPNSVMETSLFAQVPALKATGQLWACAGDGRVGLVAADDAGRAAAAVLARSDPPPPGSDFLITGPEALTMTEIAALMADVLGRPITYQDLSEQDFLAALMESGMSAEEAEIGVVAHFRAWSRGGADVVTDTYRELTGDQPTDLRRWLEQHREAFA